MGLAVLTLLIAICVSAQSPDIRLVQVAAGLRNPTEIQFPPDGSGRLFVLEQAGRIRIVKDGAILDPPFLDWTRNVSSGGERGLLGLAFPPGFAAKQYFYINYTDPQGNTAVSKLRVSSDPNRADAGSEHVILPVVQPFANHNGGHVGFGPDGFLYIGMGDGGSAGDPNGNGQNLNTLLGKLLRIDTESGGDYVNPSTNPFMNRAGARPEIWAYGLRNPWKFTFDRENGNLYIGDVGQSRAEEIDFQPASSKGGENYGWNRTEGLGCYSPPSDCNVDGITMPVAQYGRSLGSSVTGGFVYRGASVPSLQGTYLYGDFGSGRLWGLRSTASGWDNRELLSTGLQISTFGEDAAGEVYVADYGNGGLYRVAAAAAGLSVVNAASFGAGLVPGSLATVFGSGIAPVVGIVLAPAFPLPTEIAGVSVTINGTRVPLAGVANANGKDQINFQLPYEVAGSARATLVVTIAGQPMASVEIPVAAAQPEIFTVQQQPAAWTIWATGLGATDNQPATGQPAPTSPLAATIADTRVTIGGLDAAVFYSGLAPLYAGLYQVNVIPPPNAASDAEVIVSVGGVSSKPWRPPARQVD
jgi:uncharacterized protein (TIGR03437 family)